MAKYKEWLEEDKLLLITAWARNGLTDEQIATNIGINPKTLYDWKKRYDPISKALKKGKEVVDIEVENALFKRALGYEYEEEKITTQEIDGKEIIKKETFKKHMAPDTTAQIFWLKNRKPMEWRDKKHEVLEGKLNIHDDPLEKLTDKELDKLIESLGDDNE